MTSYYLWCYDNFYLLI